MPSLKQLLTRNLPPLPREIEVNDYLNIVLHDASAHRVNANANIAFLWANHVAALGFNPDGVIFKCQGQRFRIGKQNGHWQTFYA